MRALSLFGPRDAADLDAVARSSGSPEEASAAANFTWEQAGRGCPP
jgi:hypothetical protein